MTATPIPILPPGVFLAEELEARDWSQADFAAILGRPAQLISDIVGGKKAITPETAAQIGAAFGTGPEIWLNLQARYDLWLAQKDPAANARLEAVRVRGAMNERAPVALLVRRGYLPDAPLDEQASALLRLLEIPSFDDEPAFEAAARRHNAHEPFTPTQRAWLACARRDARERACACFEAKGLEEVAASLSGTLLEPGDFASLPERLASVGVRLVYVEAFPGSKISGASFLLDGDPERPCIALSGRGKRLDIVMFTLLHEIAHIVRGDLKDAAPFVDEGDAAVGDEVEASTDRLAAGWFLPRGFPEAVPRNVRRPWVLAEASRQGVHPFVVIGSLQKEGKLDWKTELVRGAPRVDGYLAAWS